MWLGRRRKTSWRGPDSECNRHRVLESRLGDRPWSLCQVTIVSPAQLLHPALLLTPRLPLSKHWLAGKVAIANDAPRNRSNHPGHAASFVEDAAIRDPVENLPRWIFSVERLDDTPTQVSMYPLFLDFQHLNINIPSHPPNPSFGPAATKPCRWSSCTTIPADPGR